jgi:hypothetical protein
MTEDRRDEDESEECNKYVFRRTRDVETNGKKCLCVPEQENNTWTDGIRN